MRFFLLPFFILFSFNFIFSQESTLAVGDRAPFFEGIDQNNETINSKEMLEDRKLVVVFYRGAWCPYCTKHMSDLQDSLDLILETGANLIAITPEQPYSIARTIHKSGAKFSVLHDEGYEIMEAFGTKFLITQETVPHYYNKVLERTKEANANNDRILPVPATFVIDNDGTIIYMQYDTDISKQAPVKEILEALKTETL